MPTRIFRVRLDAILASALRDLAESWRQPVSAVMRDAVKDLLAHLERYPELLAARTPYALMR